MGVCNTTSRLGRGPGGLFYNVMNPADITSAFYWNGNSYTNSWSANRSWMLGISAPTVNPNTNIIRFNSLTYNTNPTYADSYRVIGIIIGDGYTETGKLSVTGLTLAPGISGINMLWGAGDLFIKTTNVALCGAQTWNNDSLDGDLTIGGIISGSSLFTKTGVGTLTLDGANTFTSGIALSGGILNLNVAGSTGVNGSYGTGGLRIGGGGINNTSGSAKTLAHNGNILVLGDFQYGTTSGTSNNNLTFNLSTGWNFTGGTRVVNCLGASTLIINGSISNGGFTKAGVGALQLSGTNTYTGQTTLSGGVLTQLSFNAIPGGIDSTGGLSNILFNGGVLELGINNFLRQQGTGGNQWQMTGGASGWSAITSTRTLTPGSLIWGSSTFNPSMLVLNAATATANINLTNSLDLGSSNRQLLVGALRANISGDVTGSGGGFTKTGSGSLTLAGAGNTFTGDITYGGGTLLASSMVNGKNFTFTANSILNLFGGYVGGTVTVNAGVTVNIYPSIANTHSYAAAVGSTTSILTVENGIGSAVITISNVSAFLGALRVGPGSGSSPTFILGKLTDGAGYGNLQFGGSFAGTATFSFSGGAVALANRQIEILSGSTSSVPILLNNQTGAGNTVTISTALINNRAGATTLYIGGTNAENNTFSGVIGNGSGTISIIKISTGKWILPNNNTFSGSVNCNDGTLELNGNNSFTGAVTVGNTAATLTLSGINQFAGTVSLLDTLIINTIKDYGIASALGKQVSGPSITFSLPGTSNIIYTGIGESSNRTLYTQPGDASTRNGNCFLYNNGSGALIFTAVAFNSSTTGMSGRTNVLNLGGTYIGGTNDIQGVIIDNVAGALTGIKKIDACTWRLAGNNTYTGTTTVNGGVLQVTGSLASGSVVTVSGGTLLGAGTVSGPVTVVDVANSTIQGSLSTGTLNTGALTFAGANARLKVGTNGTTNCSLISSTGAVTLGGMKVNFDSTLALDAGTYTLISGTSMSGTVSAGNLPIGRSWTSLGIVGTNLVAVLA